MRLVEFRRGKRWERGFDMSDAGHGDDLNDVDGWSVNPFAAFVDSRMGANGANEPFGGWRNALGLFDDVFERRAHIPVAELVQAQSAGVPVNGHVATREVELHPDEVDILPVKEGFLDGFALGVVTNDAQALVTRERGGASFTPGAAARAKGEAARDAFLICGCGGLARRTGTRLRGGLGIGTRRESVRELAQVNGGAGAREVVHGAF